MGLVPSSMAAVLTFVTFAIGANLVGVELQEGLECLRVLQSPLGSGIRRSSAHGDDVRDRLSIRNSQRATEKGTETRSAIAGWLLKVLASQTVQAGTRRRISCQICCKGDPR